MCGRIGVENNPTLQRLQGLEAESVPLMLSQVSERCVPV